MKGKGKIITVGVIYTALSEAIDNTNQENGFQIMEESIIVNGLMKKMVKSLILEE